MDNNDSNPEETDVGINGVINSMEDEIRLKAQTDHNIESTDDTGSIKQGQLTADGSNETTSVTLDIGELTYYDGVGAELGFVEDLITPHELGVIMNHMHGDSMAHIMYSDAVYGYAETTEVFYGSLWQDDIWHLNEHPVIRDDLESPQQEEFGITSGVQFYDVWNDTTTIQCVNENDQGL
jgi:hypothetical protein